MSACTLCEKRRPQRWCPGVREEICARCCGEEREVTINCPFECEYLQEARRREKPPNRDPRTLPNADIRVTEQFLEENEWLLAQVSRLLLTAATESSGVVDDDVQEALEAMIKTLRTRESGLIYETRPNNPYAGVIQQRVQAGIEEVRRQEAKSTGVHTIRDKGVLGVLVFLQQLAFRVNNGRRRGRAFLDFVRTNFVAHAPAPEQRGSVVTP